MNKEIDNNIDKIINYIKTSNSYINYLKCKEQLSKDTYITNVIKEIKDVQKKIVRTNNKELEIKLEELKEILNTNPVYLEYLENLDDVNNMINIFENRINKYFNDLFN